MTTNKPMNGEQLDELMAVAVRMQRDAEVARDFPSANFAYAVQVAVLELRRTREISSALAAENGQMLRLLTDISENHGEFVNEEDEYLYASVPLDYVSEVNMYVSRDVNAENPFKETDAFLAEVRASTLEDLAKKKRAEKMSLPPNTFALGSVIAALDMQANELDDLATQLRQEAAQ